MNRLLADFASDGRLPLKRSETGASFSQSRLLAAGSRAASGLKETAVTAGFTPSLTWSVSAGRPVLDWFR